MYTPLNPNFTVAKLGYAGVYLIFLFLLQNIDCGYSLEPHGRVPTIFVLSKIRKIFIFFLGKFSIFEAQKISLLVYCMGKFS